MTLLDRYENFLNSWVRRKPEEPTKEVVDKVFKDNEWFDTTKSEKFEPSTDELKLTSINCRKLALTCPLFMKGVIKKSRDTFRAGFTIETKDGKKMKAYEQIWIDGFNKRNDITALLDETKQCVHVYGEGIWYIRFRSEIETDKYDRSSPPPEYDLPFKVYLLDPEKVNKYTYKNDAYRKKGIKHLKYGKGLKSYLIHPDRIIPFYEKKFPFSDFGISDVTVLRHIISSVADVDIATGQILKWFAHGFTWWTKEGATPEEKKQMLKVLSKHPNGLVGDEKYHLEVLNPEAIDPEPFYKYLVTCIAGVLVMPTHTLTGIEVGRVTGAEAGFSDYYRDINDAQKLVYAPRLKKLYQMIFDYHTYNDDDALLRDIKYVFDYVINWTRTFVNEMAETELLFKRAETVHMLISTKNSFPIITPAECRDIMNRGQIEFDKPLDTSEIPKPPKPEKITPEERNAVQAMINARKKIDAGIELSEGEKEQLGQAFRLKHVGNP